MLPEKKCIPLIKKGPIEPFGAAINILGFNHWFPVLTAEDSYILQALQLLLEVISSQCFEEIQFIQA